MHELPPQQPGNTSDIMLSQKSKGSMGGLKLRY